MTQKEEVLDYLKRHGSITTIEAFHIGITRLSARIWDLRNDGIEIRSSRVSYKANDGKNKHYDMYTLGVQR